MKLTILRGVFRGVGISYSEWSALRVFEVKLTLRLFRPGITHQIQAKGIRLVRALIDY